MRNSHPKDRPLLRGFCAKITFPNLSVLQCHFTMESAQVFSWGCVRAASFEPTEGESSGDEIQFNSQSSSALRKLFTADIRCSSWHHLPVKFSITVMPTWTAKWTTYLVIQTQFMKSGQKQKQKPPQKKEGCSHKPPSTYHFLRGALGWILC